MQNKSRKCGVVQHSPFYHKNECTIYLNGSDNAGEKQRKISHLVLRKKSTGKIRKRLLDEDGFIRRVACICFNPMRSKVE